MEKILKRENLILFAGAVGAGFLSGLMGAGGGIILYFVLGALYGKAAKENLVISSVSVMFFCVVSLFFYKGSASLTLERIIGICLPAALGGALGAWLLARIPAAAAKRLFSAVVILSGILMLLK